VAKIFKPSNKKQSLAKNIRIDITRLDVNGCGVGHYQNKAIFIEQALPGETVLANMIEKKSKYSRAKLTEVLKPNKQRIEAACRHFSSCGGCDLQHLELSEQLTFKKQKVSNLLARNGIETHLPWQNPIGSDAWHYRRKARLGVQYNKIGQATLGFRQKSSNQLIAIKQCPVLVEPLSRIFSPLSQLLTKLSGNNAIGHIEVIATDDITLVVRQLEKLTEQDKQHWQSFAGEFICQVFFDDGKTVSALSDECSHELHYLLDDNIKINFATNNFIQVNHQVNNKMIQQAIDWLSLDKQDKVLDLFCGLGNFSLPIAKRVSQVIGIEGVNSMVKQATDNATENEITNCQFYQADLNSDWQDQTWAKPSLTKDRSNEVNFNKVLLDPARAGAYQAIEQLAKLAIEQVLYVSCDPASLAKDSALLLSQGYKIEKIALIDMFCQTKHVETMVLFTR